MKNNELFEIYWKDVVFETSEVNNIENLMMNMSLINTGGKYKFVLTTRIFCFKSYHIVGSVKVFSSVNI